MQSADSITETIQITPFWFELEKWNTHFQLKVVKFMHAFLERYQPAYVGHGGNKDYFGHQRYTSFCTVWNTYFKNSLGFYQQKFAQAYAVITVPKQHQKKLEEAKKDIAKYRVAVNEILDLFLPKSIDIVARPGRVSTNWYNNWNWIYL